MYNRSSRDLLTLGSHCQQLWSLQYFNGGVANFCITIGNGFSIQQDCSLLWSVSSDEIQYMGLSG